LVALLAVLLPLPFIGQTPLSYVEVLTAEALELSTRGLIEHRLAGAHTPTWYLLLKTLGLAHQPEWLLRLPSTLAHSAAALLAAAIGRRMAGRPGLLAAGLLLALQPVLLEFANYARPYAAVMAASLWMLLSLAALADRPRLAVAALTQRRGAAPALRRMRWLWLQASLAPLLAASLLPLGLLVWALLDATLLAWLWWRAGKGRRARRRLARRLLLARLVPVLLAAVGYLALYSAFDRLAGHYWPKPLSFRAALQVLETTFGWLPGLDRDRFLPLAGDWVLGLALGLLALLGFFEGRRRAARLLAATLALGVPLLLLLLSLHTSLLVIRYFAPGILGLALLAGAGGADLARRLPRTAFSLLALGLATLLALQALDALTGDRKRPRIEVLAGWIAEARPGPGEEHLVTNFEATPYTLNYYLRRLGSEAEAVQVDAATARALLEAGGRLWLVDVYTEAWPAWLKEVAGESAVATCERHIGELVTVVVASRAEAALPPLCRPAP
jgi:hypothetical protein